MVKPIDLARLRKDLSECLEKGIKAVAVMLLHSYTFRAHEQAVGDLCKELGFTQVSLSSEVMPMVKAVPRGLTSCADAYLNPSIQRYLTTFKVGFDAGLKDVELLFMQSDGGLAGGRHCQCAVHAMYWVVKSGRACARALTLVHVCQWIDSTASKPSFRALQGESSGTPAPHTRSAGASPSSALTWAARQQTCHGMPDSTSVSLRPRPQALQFKLPSLILTLWLPEAAPACSSCPGSSAWAPSLRLPFLDRRATAAAG